MTADLLARWKVTAHLYAHVEGCGWTWAINLSAPNVGVFARLGPKKGRRYVSHEGAIAGARRAARRLVGASAIEVAR